MLFGHKATSIPSPEESLPGRDQPLAVSGVHAVNGRAMFDGYPEGTQVALFGMGCFWGAERIFWETTGVWVTAVGYAGGSTPNPTYREVCSGQTGHTEAVLVAYDPTVIDFERLLGVFWEGHDPTQGMRQGNDRGTQYRSFIGVADGDRLAAAEASRDRYARALADRGYGAITTEIRGDATFFPAEEEHQQYLHKNPGGYCGIGGTGVSCPVGLGA